MGFQGTDFAAADIEIDAVNDDLTVHVDARSDGEFSVSKIEATKSFDTDDAAVTVTPRYDVGCGSSDVVVSYVKDDNSITVSKQIDDDNRVAPTISSNGDFSVEWERNLGDDDSLTTTLKPNESIDVEWNDGAWEATINMPLDGTSITGANVSIKRDVNF